MKALPSGLIAIRDNARTRRDHERRLDDHERSAHRQRTDQADYETAEKRRLASLDDARVAREREELVATELGHLARRGQRLAASLRDDVVADGRRDLKSRYAELNES